MKAYVSLHTRKPESQMDAEVKYTGYERVEFDYDEDTFAREPVKILFPRIEDRKSKDVATYMAIGPAEKGNGPLWLRAVLLPLGLKDEPERRTTEFWEKNGATPEQAEEFVKNHGYNVPTVGCHDETPPLPDGLNPIVKLMYRLTHRGLVDAADFHPRLYEAMNDELTRHGVEVVKIVRQGSARMEQKIQNVNLKGHDA